MPSPFPGMDPFLESPAIWPDFHNSFIAYLSASINAVLPPPLFCSICSRVYDEETAVEPDADVPLVRAPATVADAVQARPVIVRIPRDEVTEWFAEIHADPGGERLVTTIELLSPTNKRPGSRGARKYRMKQREMLDSPVHLVEIDLLRGGKHSTAVPLTSARRAAGPFDYHVCVHRYVKPSDFEVYPIALAGPLPAIAIPLLPDEPDVTVALKPILARCYDTGHYARRVRYAEPVPEPELTPDQRTWVAERLATPASPGA